MGVKVYDDEYGYRLRVYRKVGEKVFDEVYWLTENGKRMTSKKRKSIESQVMARDHELEKKQMVFQKRLLADKQYQCFHSDGRVIGVRREEKVRDSGNVTDLFKLRIRKSDGEVVHREVSINYYGKQSWGRVVDIICSHRNVKKGTKVYKNLVAAKTLYI
ncbi:MAG: hypothetical protein ACC707_06270 [Thiohalomonadales bacterium]